MQNPYKNSFKVQKGYCNHLIEMQGIHSKKHIQHFTRDGKKFITKAARDNEYSIDPAHRCERHDRHKIAPGYRNIPVKSIDANANSTYVSKSSLDQIADVPRKKFEPI